jgi:SAM-dependent methyltransferase
LKTLLLGCGNSRVKRMDAAGEPVSRADDWGELVTADHDPGCGADVLHDFDVKPWPFADGEFDEVHAYEVLEHLGQQGDARAFFADFSEMWRILKPGGHLVASVPRWDRMWAWGDPSHRRVINEGTLVFLDQRQYAAQVGKTPMTDFRWLWKGDFRLVAGRETADQLWFVLRAIK